MIYKLVRQVLNHKGKHVPEDYSLVCFDYSGQDWAAEGITCSVHQGYTIGSKVASQLLKMIHRRDHEQYDYSLVLQPTIYVGAPIRNLSPLKP